MSPPPARAEGAQDGLPSPKEPKYLAVRRAIQERIQEGAYPLGRALPSEHLLACEFGTTRMTVRNAVDALVESGVIRRIQGKGAYVARLEPQPASSAPRGFRELTRSAHLVPDVRALSRAVRPAGPLYADLFGIEPDDEVFCLRRLNSADGAPVSIERTVIPLALFPGIQDRDIAAFSLYETYAMYGHEVRGAQEVLNLTRLSARDAGLLQVEAGSPALALDCRSFDAEGTLLECVHSLSRAGRDVYRYRY